MVSRMTHASCVEGISICFCSCVAMYLKTYDGDLATKVVLDLARLDRIWGVLMDD